MTKLQHFDPQEFLTHYWQKQPLVIKQGIANFIDPIDEHDLAGLACEPDVDSRIVSYHQQQWQVSHGPIDDFEKACQGNWSLLVQAVDQHIPDTLPLISLFNFLPYWRIDDLMVSYSVADSGVGPHLDQYDVFIVQGKGRRRWQVGNKGDFLSIFPHPDLRQIEPFEPIIDEILEPGDIIYIPPGFPHNGVALGECLNYSIGFRAPNQTELFSQLADAVEESQLFTQRYADPDIQLRRNPGEVSQSEIAALKQLMINAIQSPEFDTLLLKSLSHSANNNELESEEPYTPEEVQLALENGQQFVRCAEAKAIFKSDENSDNFTFYIQGQRYQTSKNIKDLLLELFANDYFFAKNTTKLPEWLEFVKMFTILINAGYWYPAH